MPAWTSSRAALTCTSCSSTCATPSSTASRPRTASTTSASPSTATRCPSTRGRRRCRPGCAWAPPRWPPAASASTSTTRSAASSARRSSPASSRPAAISPSGSARSPTATRSTRSSGRRRRSKPVRGLLAAAVLTAIAAGCGGGGDRPGEGGRPPETLHVASGGRGGIYFVYGAALAKAISGRLPGYRATSQETTGSVENLLRLRDGRADIALTLGDTALDAVEGREAFQTPVQLRALAQIYRSYVQVVTPRGSPIRSLRDLRGKRVSVGSPDSGTEVVAERALSVAHMSPSRDIRRRRLGVAESATALEDGSIDAFFWSGGLPTSAITDLARGQAISLLDLGALARPLRARYGGGFRHAPVPPPPNPGGGAAPA